MKKNSIYSRRGDDGTTQLASGQRVPKTCARLEAYGTVDELNSQLGLLLTYVTESEDRQMLLSCQRLLFSIGAWLATENASKDTCHVTAEDVQILEHAIDKAGEGLPRWRGFVLPGGTRAAAVCHVCRTVCRRAERRILTLGQESPVEPRLLAYINRLSDYLFVLASRLNLLGGVEEILWENRTT